MQAPLLRRWGKKTMDPWLALPASTHQAGVLRAPSLAGMVAM